MAEAKSAGSSGEALPARQHIYTFMSYQRHTCGLLTPSKTHSFPRGTIRGYLRSIKIANSISIPKTYSLNTGTCACAC
jgi:hypothetical protein